MNSDFFGAKLQEADLLIERAIEEKRLPGGVLWLERRQSVYRNAFGARSVEPEVEPATIETIYDLASLTKVVATASSVLLLVERGLVQLDTPLTVYIPEFASNGKERITVRHLLTHTSGLRPGLSPAPFWEGYEKAIELACAEKLLNAPGAIFRYSDINFILLGELVRRVAEKPLDQFAEENLFGPLGMADTGFRPADSLGVRIAPTERVEGAVLRGMVHDPTARRMGGVAGHAGLFSTASDLARFARMLLNGGALEGRRIFQTETVQLLTTVQSPEHAARRGLGWDIDSAYSRPRGSHFPRGSFGHTGWTGTSLWIDPFSETFVIFLSNRVHPDGRGNVLGLQHALGTVAAEAVRDFNFAYVPGALPPRPSAEKTVAQADSLSTREVLNGIDVLAEEDYKPLKGLKIGLITNHTGTDRRRRSTIDLLEEAPDVQLKALFSPEHGIRGLLDEKVPDDRDERTGLPIYSLYGETRTPRPEHLEGLDALVFDIQDIGCRFYTYISTMGLAMDAAAKAGLKFFVLDRVNPINGSTIDGPVLNAETSFVGFHPIPVRHGMTVGELARLFNAEREWKVDLTVIPLKNWQRALWLDQTALPWINPSPNMRSLTQATLYPGVGLIEFCAISVGRGTDTPFEQVGAPYIDDLRLAVELNALELAGVRFVPVRFTPAASVFKGEECKGVFLFLTDRQECSVVQIGMALARTIHRLYPEQFQLDRMQRLLGHKATLEALRDGRKLDDIAEIWGADLQEFKHRRRPWLLYD